MELDIEPWVTATGTIVEAVGVVAIVVGVVFATFDFVARGRAGAYERYRKNLGRALLLGLELLVAGDIIRTVTTEPSLESVVVLAIIVLIRTFLSWSIELEVEGRFPWQHKQRASP